MKIHNFALALVVTLRYSSVYLNLVLLKSVTIFPNLVTRRNEPDFEIHNVSLEMSLQVVLIDFNSNLKKGLLFFIYAIY